MYRLIPFRTITDVILTGCLLGAAAFAQTARLEPDTDLIQTARRSDDNGAFFLPDPESKAMVATVRASALNEIGTAAYARKSYDEAIAAFRRSIEDNPGLSAVHLNLSIALTAAGRTLEAVAPALEAVRLAPQDPKARAGLCGVYLEMKSAVPAVDCFDELIKMRPDDVSYLTDRNTALFLLGKKTEAIDSMKLLLRRFPSHAVGFNYLGVMLHETKDTEKALDAFRTAISIDPNSDVYRYNLGLAQFAKHDKAGALSQYKFLKERSSEFADKLYAQIYADKVLVVDK